MMNAVRRHRDCRQLSQIDIVELSIMSSAVSRRCEIQRLTQIVRHRSCLTRMVLSGMLGAVSLRRAGSDHRAVCHAEWFSSLLASRAVTMVDGLPRAASFRKFRKIDQN